MSDNWARALSKGLITPSQLKEAGFLREEEQPAIEKAQNLFDIRVPQALMDGLKQQDPTLWHQVIPTAHELDFQGAELTDPIGDEAHSPNPALTHRYPDRALLKLTYQCAVYCRFCFRRYKVSDPAHNPTQQDVEKALETLALTPQIREVILTGGDPLVWTDARLEPVLRALGQIPHLKIIRIHTRIPTMLPERVTPELVQALRATGKAVWVVAHVNAPSELNENARAAIGRFADGGIPLLSQSVLLKGVNDSVETLLALFEDLSALRVSPYLLHYPDLAKGTHHFRIPLERAIELMSALRGRLSGHAIPRLVVDIPGGKGKVPLEKEWATQSADGAWEFLSPLDGTRHRVEYPRS